MASLDNLVCFFILVFIPKLFIEVSNIGQHVSVSLWVYHIIGQISNDSSTTVLFNVIIKPSNKNFFIAELFEYFIIFTFLFEYNNFGMVLQWNLIWQMDLD